MRMWTTGLAMGVVVMATAAGAWADPIPVGSGANSAVLKVNFWDPAQSSPVTDVEFEVFFDGTTTGLGLFDIVEAETTLTTVRQDFGFGIYIDGIAYGDHANLGYGGGEAWWHYWTKADAADPWSLSWVGVAVSPVADGGWNGWTYGRAGEPVPEPATLGLVALGVGALVARRRGGKGVR